MAITDDEYVIVPDDKMIKAKDSKEYIEHMKKYVGKHMSNYGFEKNVIIVKDEDKYIDKLEKISYQLDNDKVEDSLHKIINTLLILEV